MNSSMRIITQLKLQREPRKNKDSLASINHKTCFRTEAGFFNIYLNPILFRLNSNSVSLPLKTVDLKRDISDKLCCFPRQKPGRILGYANENLTMPNKIIEMGLLPETQFKILYQAPFKGPLYIEFGDEKSRIALREEEARFIIVDSLT